MNEIIGKDTTSSDIDRLKKQLHFSSSSKKNNMTETYLQEMAINTIGDEVISEDHDKTSSSSSPVSNKKNTGINNNRSSSSFDKYVNDIFGDDFDYKDPLKSKSSEKKQKNYSNGIKNKSTQKKHLNLRLKKHLKIYDNDSTTVSDMSNEQKQKLINKLQLYNVNLLKDLLKR